MLAFVNHFYKNNILKYDRYTIRRGEPKRLELFCNKCKTHIMSYQKDGPGPLYRCYLDRIIYPKSITQHESIETMPNLICYLCDNFIGIPGVYVKHNETRLVYNMFPDAFFEGY